MQKRRGGGQARPPISRVLLKPGAQGLREAHLPSAKLSSPQRSVALSDSQRWRRPRRVPVVTGTASASLDQAALTSIIFRVVTCGAGILTSSIPFTYFASTWATSMPSGSSKVRWNAPYASSRTK
jgi:hypothetical protein